MKKYLLALCCVWAAGQCLAQETTKMTRDTGLFREKFEVLKSDPKIKQGKYAFSVISSGKILTSGFYKNNKKDGLWDEYNNAGYVVAEGKYADGKKVGVWNYYGKMWVEDNKYDFTKNQLTYHRGVKTDSTFVYQVVKGKDTINTIMERPPVYLGGTDLMDRALIYNLHYPAQAVAAGVNGRVTIVFTVDEHGRTRDYKVAQSLGHGLDEEALRVVKSIPDDWVAGTLSGKPVATIIRIPVAFKTKK